MITPSQQFEWKISLRRRVDDVCDRMVASDGYAYTAGYLSSALTRALEMLTKDSREKFLSDMERNVK